MLELKLCKVVFYNDQHRLHLLPEASMEWGEKVLASIIHWGDVDIFCEHPVYLDNGDFAPWAVDRVVDYNPGRPLKTFDVIMMVERTYECVELRVTVPDWQEDDVETLAAEWIFLTTRALSDMINIVERSKE